LSYTLQTTNEFLSHKLLLGQKSNFNKRLRENLTEISHFWGYGKWNLSANMQQINIHKWISLKYERVDNFHGHKRNLYRSTNKMSPNVPRNILLDRFYLEKKNYGEIRWPFITRKTNVKCGMTWRNQLFVIFFHSKSTFLNGFNDL
jgi:hypothetical protein